MINFNDRDYYLSRHKKFNAKIGDIVTIFRTAEDYEDGWYNSWSPPMSNTVGKIGKIIDDCNEYGFRLAVEGVRTFVYPYFVLTIVK